MSRSRICGGTMTKITGGQHSMFSEKEITTSSGKCINETGDEKGLSFNTPKDVPRLEQANSDGINREVFLTFDDGIQAGTKEVLSLLKAKGIKGTFFLTGIHLRYFIEKSKDRKNALAVLKDIYENHIIGNHSYSHVNDFYKNAYKDGIKFRGDGSKDEDKMPLFTDFTKCKEQLLMYLEEIYGKASIKNKAVTLAKNQTIPLARFPGRNTWYTNNIIDIDSDNSQDTKDEAKELYDKRNYQIYGWDVEWKMNFQFVEISKNSVNEKVNNQTMDFAVVEDAHPYYDMYSKENIGKDRLLQAWETVRDEILDYAFDNPWTPFDKVSKTKGKVVLLMHERAFRRGKLINGKVDLTKTDYLDKLSNLIDYFIKIKAQFKTLDKY